MRNVILLIGAVFLGGCASVSKIDHYDAPRQRVSELINTENSIRILVRDIRPYVLNGDKSRGFFGLVRVYGAPISLNMKDGTVLTQHIASKAKSITQQAIPDSRAWGIADASTFNQIIEELDIGYLKLLFDIKEWKVDSPSGFGRTAFYFDVSLDVVNEHGDLLATTTTSGKDVVADLKEVNYNYAIALETLISEPSIINAINSSLSSTASQNKKPTHDGGNEQPNNKTLCSVDQILNMQSSGLTKKQIAAACNPSQ